MIAARLVDWQRRHGRNDLPWQGTRDAYRIWLSEVMLQQTRVASVVPYFLRFVERFPAIEVLAAADEDEVLTLWSGLGYYSRARNLHRCARELVAQRGGVFPADPAELARLPGIGRSTAAAIAVFAFGRRAAILDGNVRRVLARWAGIRGHAGEPDVLAGLWRTAERELPHESLEAYTQGLMDLGAGPCSRHRPDCARCPIADDCVAHREGLVASIPAPRPHRALPLREHTWLVIRRGGEWLLEKRAPNGVWGGMWSLPEVANDDAGNATQLVLQRFALRTRVRGALAHVDHVFTHFRLRAQPIVLECEDVCLVADAAGVGERADRREAAIAPTVASSVRWLAAERAHTAPLPAPVKALLAALGNGTAQTARLLRPFRESDAAAGTDESATAA